MKPVDFTKCQLGGCWSDKRFHFGEQSHKETLEMNTQRPNFIDEMTGLLTMATSDEVWTIIPLL